MVYCISSVNQTEGIPHFPTALFFDLLNTSRHYKWHDLEEALLAWPDTTIGMITNHQPPTTDNQQPTTNNQQPTTNHKPQQQQEEQHKEQQQPTSNHQPPTANNHNNNNKNYQKHKNNNGRTACSRAADLVCHLCWIRSLASWTRSQLTPPPPQPGVASTTWASYMER